jgi:hypothetical protein
MPGRRDFRKTVSERMAIGHPPPGTEGAASSGGALVDGGHPDVGAIRPAPPPHPPGRARPEVPRRQCPVPPLIPFARDGRLEERQRVRPADGAPAAKWAATFRSAALADGCTPSMIRALRAPPPDEAIGPGRHLPRRECSIPRDVPFTSDRGRANGERIGTANAVAGTERATASSALVGARSPRMVPRGRAAPPDRPRRSETHVGRPERRVPLEIEGGREIRDIRDGSHVPRRASGYPRSVGAA